MSMTTETDLPEAKLREPYGWLCRQGFLPERFAHTKAERDVALKQGYYVTPLWSSDADALASIRAERDAAVAALEPLAMLELPKYRPEGTTGFYSIRFSAIEAAKSALAARAIAGEQKNG